MFKSDKEFESAMKEILIYVRDEKPLDEFFKSVDYRNAFIECDKRELLQGVLYFINEKGLPVIENCQPYITYNGLKFIENN